MIGNDLLEAGADPLELMELDEAARRLRALPSQSWTPSAASTSGGEQKVRFEVLTENLAGQR